MTSGYGILTTLERGREMHPYNVEAQQVTQILHELRDKPELFKERLFPLLYEVMKKMARKQLGSERDARTLQPTVLVHEAYLRLAGGNQNWDNRAHFLGCAANAMRQILIDYARRRLSAKRGGGAVQVPLEDRPMRQAVSLDDILAVDEALTRLRELDPLKAELIHLKFFGGLTVIEAAQVVGVSASTAKEHLRAAQAWINKELSGNR